MKERRLVSSSLDSSWHTVPANRVVGAGGSERPFKPLDRARERSAHHLGFAQVSQVLVPSRLQSWRIQNEKIDEPGNTGHTATAGETPSSLLAQSLCLRLRFPQPHKNPVAARIRLQKTVRQHMLSPCVYQFRQPRTDAHAQRRSRERIVPFCRHDWCSQVLKVPREGYLRNDSHSALPLISTITNQRTFASEPNARRSMVPRWDDDVFEITPPRRTSNTYFCSCAGQSALSSDARNLAPGNLSLDYHGWAICLRNCCEIVATAALRGLANSTLNYQP